MRHAAKTGAGNYSPPITVEQPPAVAREFVPADIQRRAVAFLNEQLFTTPEWLIDQELIAKARFTPVNAICSLQSSVLSRLLSRNTFDKMSENEALNGSKAYTAAQLFADLRPVFWDNPMRSDIFRRNIQKTYVENLIGLLDKAQAEADKRANRRSRYSDAPAIARGELIALERLVKSAAGQTSGVARSHYQNLQALIEDALDNK